MKRPIKVNIVVLVLVAGVALLNEPIPVVQAGPVPPTPSTCTLTGTYTVDATTGTDVLSPSVTPSGDCNFGTCSFTFSSRVGDVGDFFAICQSTIPCDKYTTIGVDADVTSFPVTDEPEVISYCSTNPLGDAQCFTGGGTGKSCPGKQVDCFAGIDQGCSASKKLGGGIKGTFVCILNLPEPPVDAFGITTVNVIANCKMS